MGKIPESRTSGLFRASLRRLLLLAPAARAPSLRCYVATWGVMFGSPSCPICEPSDSSSPERSRARKPSNFVVLSAESETLKAFGTTLSHSIQVLKCGQKSNALDTGRPKVVSGYAVTRAQMRILSRERISPISGLQNTVGRDGALSRGLLTACTRREHDVRGRDQPVFTEANARNASARSRSPTGRCQ